MGHAAMLRKASNVEPLDENVRQPKFLYERQRLAKSSPAIIQGYINLEAEDSKYASEDTPRDGYGRQSTRSISFECIDDVDLHRYVGNLSATAKDRSTHQRNDPMGLLLRRPAKDDKASGADNHAQK